VLDASSIKEVTQLLEMVNTLSIDGQGSDESDTEQHPSDILSAHMYHSSHARRPCNWDSDTVSKLVHLIDLEFKTKSRDGNERSVDEFGERLHSGDEALRACIPAHSSRPTFLSNSSNGCLTSQGRAEPPAVE
jgi:hypothetical protein